MASIPFRREAQAETQPRTPWIRSVVSGAGVGLAAGTALTAAASAVAAYLARVVVTPVHEKRADVEILAVIQTSQGQEVVLTSTPETIVEGTYGLHFDAGRGLARIGAVTALEPRRGPSPAVWRGSSPGISGRPAAAGSAPASTGTSGGRLHLRGGDRGDPGG